MSSGGAWEEANNIGNILVRRGSVTKAQLEEAVKRQLEERAHGRHTKIGQVCVDMLFCTTAEVMAALDEQRSVLAPPSNEKAVTEAFRDLDRAVRKRTRSTAKLEAVCGPALSAFGRR